MNAEQAKEVAKGIAENISRHTRSSVEDLSQIVFAGLLKITPQDTQEGIPLQIDPRWRWAAMDKNEGCHAYENKPRDDVGEWTPNGGQFVRIDSIFMFPKHLHWRDSLHQIINGRLVKYADIPADGEPVWVRHATTDEWKRRISAGNVLDGELVCYADGYTKWTSQISGTSGWRYWRRPTQEELNQ